MSLAELTQFMAGFVAERDWQRYHSPKNLSMSIAIEAAELMECFQWTETVDVAALKRDADRYRHVQEEVADILAYCLSLASNLDFDLEGAYLAKMEKNRLRYPPEKCVGQEFRKA
ncbi:MAG: nucleotide pyrophosphohydrolase [Candidatus Wallbacteria bacterium]|nr:nucleotide pyrophosphohydrolase [Candidatus Wallbacteria bacterium]